MMLVASCGEPSSPPGPFHLGGGGEYLWALSADTFGVPGASDVAILPSGGVGLVGTYTERVALGDGQFAAAGMADLFLALLSSGGDVLWVRPFGTIRRDVGTILEATTGGELAYFGESDATISLGGDSLPFEPALSTFYGRHSEAGAHAQSVRVQSRRAWSVTMDGSGDFVLLAADGENPGGSISRFSASGERLWRQVVGPGFLNDVAFHNDGRIVGVGYDGAGPLSAARFANGEGDAELDCYDYLPGAYTVVAMFSEDGAPLGRRVLTLAGETSCAWGKRVRVHASGDIVVGGECLGTVSTAVGDMDCLGGGAFLATLDVAGDVVAWTDLDGDLSITDLEVRDDGIALVGSFSGVADLGGGQFTAENSHSMYVARLDLQARHIWSRRFGAFGEPRLALASDGTLAVTSSFNGSVDFGDARLDSSGTGGIFVVAFGQ